MTDLNTLLTTCSNEFSFSNPDLTQYVTTFGPNSDAKIALYGGDDCYETWGYYADTIID